MVVTAMVVLAGTGSAWAELTDGLVAHWTFDEGSGNMASDDVGGNDGTIYGAQWAEGLFGGALSFDGNGDYISILEKTLPDTGPYSISLWLYKDGNYQRRYVVGGHDQNACWIHYYVNDNARFTVGSKNRGSGRTVIRDAGNKTFENGRPANDQWTHVVVIFDSDGKTVKLYRDAFDTPNVYNKPGYSGYTDPGWDFSGTDTVIGRRGSGTAYYNGLMDDVRIYNRALSESEVQQLYLSSLPTLETLEIVGPGEVAEDSQIPYKAIAYYDIGSPKDVTDLAIWSVEPNDNCGITAGLLAIEMIDLPMDVTIAAQYNEGDVNESAEKDVSIFAICPSGSALEFDGVDDYVSFENNVITTTEFTVAAWANQFGSGGGQNGSNIIFQQRDNDAPPASAKSTIVLFTDTNVGSYARAFVRDSHGVELVLNCPRKGYNQWHHYAITVGLSHIVFYIDGDEVERISNIHTGDYVTSVDYIGIGKHRYKGADKGFFNGLIDEVTIYNRALSAEEIQILMHRRPDTDDPTLVGYWNFDEGSGQVAGDSVGDNDGTLESGYCDPNDPECSGPVWINSDAPVGICSVEGIVERNLLKVLDMKNDVLDILDEAIGKEEALWEYMDVVFKDRDFGNTSKGDVVKAKQKIHSAIQAEEQAETAVDKSIDSLDDALDTLGIE